ncbi:MAG TPA: hypothetical protein VGU63_00030 [Candidatus Acidoferrales bacterium]|nr:hypothetical protein [Candidatus Acidoferrales bacterium]
MPKSYDAIIIGGGHNGLVNAAYLARASQDNRLSWCVNMHANSNWYKVEAC